MKNTRKKARVRYYIPENYSDEAVAEMKSKLVTLDRNQLEMLVCVLSQEIIRLEHQSQVSSSLNFDKQIIYSDCSAVQNEEREPTQSVPSCRTCRRILESITSVSQFENRKSGEIKQHQETGKDEQFLFSGDDEKNIHSNNEITSCNENNNNSKHTSMDLHLSYHQPSPLPKNQDNHMLINLSDNNESHFKLISGKEFNEDIIPSSADKFSKEAGCDSRKISSDEKPQNHGVSCKERKKNLKSQDNVEVRHTEQVVTKDNSGVEAKSIDSIEHLFRQKRSLHDNANIAMPRCFGNNKILLSSRNKKYMHQKQLSIKVPNIDFETTHGKEQQVFLCYLCKGEFKSKLILTWHMKSDHKMAQYACMFCGKSFVYKHNLKVHQRNRHDRTTVLCSYCGKLVLQTRLEIHMEKVHEKPMFTCHICQKGFLKRECLEGHINKHSNTKPYICEYCGRKYTYSTSLSSHKKLCTRASIPSHLQHIRSLDNKTSSFICEICGVKFDGVSGLKDHIGAKHSNKSQHCSFCGKGFQWRPSYNRHVKKCKDKTDLQRERCKQLLCQKPMGKQYVCVCGKQYPYRQSYRRHERNCQQKQEMQTFMASSAVLQVPFSEYLGSNL